jgi:hypothetical protein
MRRFSRRQFLATGTAASLAPLVGAGLRPVRGSAIPGAVGSSTPLPLSVGYLEGSDALASGWLDQPQGGRVVPAAFLGDHPSDLHAGWATMTVHGLIDGPSSNTRSPDAVMLDVDFRAVAEDPELRFYAWTMRGGSAPSRSSRSVFQAPVAPGLAWHVTRRSAGIETTAARRLTMPQHFGVARLRPGAYLLALGSATWDRARSVPQAGDPGWSDLASILVSVAPA